MIYCPCCFCPLRQPSKETVYFSCWIYQGVFKWKSLGFTMLNQSQSNQHNKIFIIVLETPNSKILKTKVNRAAHTHWIQYSTPRYRDIKRAVLGWAYLLRERERFITILSSLATHQSCWIPL